MPGNTTTTTTTPEVITDWKPRLRWVIRGGDAGVALDKRTGGQNRILQQIVTTNLGRRWQTVPVVVTDSDKIDTT